MTCSQWRRLIPSQLSKKGGVALDWIHEVSSTDILERSASQTALRNTGTQMTRRHARIENGLRKLLSIVLIYGSQTSEKIQDVLHLGLVKRFEIVDHLGRFRSIAAMGTDRLQQVRRATVMQEK